MKASYRENYDQIARDHLTHWRATGVNPWQSPEHVEAVHGATAALVHAYSQPGDAVLDAGCAMGDLMLRIHDRALLGCDFNTDYLQVARDRGLNVAWAELEDLPYAPETFDLIVMTDVLEHVLDEKVVIREALRVLRPGGVLVTRSPDSEDLTPYLDGAYRFVHLRRFDEPSLRLLFDRIFDCEVLECPRVTSHAFVAGDGKGIADADVSFTEIHAVVRKP